MFLTSTFVLYSQKDIRVVYSENTEIKNKILHIRAYRGEELWINIKPEIKNEKKKSHYSFNNIKLYRQNADNAFQY